MLNTSDLSSRNKEEKSLSIKLFAILITFALIIVTFKIKNVSISIDQNLLCNWQDKSTDWHDTKTWRVRKSIDISSSQRWPIEKVLTQERKKQKRSFCDAACGNPSFVNPCTYLLKTYYRLLNMQPHCKLLIAVAVKKK